MTTAASSIDVAEIRARIDAILRRQRQLEAELEELKRQLQPSASGPQHHEQYMRELRERRKKHLEKMRGQMTYIGDVESPVDVEWDAEK